MPATIELPRCAWSIGLIFLASPLVNGQETATSPSPAQASAASSRERLVSSKITAALAASLPKYAPPKPVDKESVDDHPGANEQVVEMAPFVVAESGADPDRRRLTIKIRDDKEKAALEAFSWKEGGALLEKGRAKLMLKYNPEHKGFDILSFKW